MAAARGAAHGWLGVIAGSAVVPVQVTTPLTWGMECIIHQELWRMELVNNPEARPPSDDGRGGFFAIDRRAWAHVCCLGMNPAIAYLVLARGTGGDNRTSKWSTHAIEKRTGISRSRAAKAITDLEQVKAVVRDVEAKRDRPKYKITPAHDIPSCEGFLTRPVSPQQQHVLDQLRDDWTPLMRGSHRRGSKEFKRWGTSEPWKLAEELVRLGCASRSKGGWHYRAVHHDVEAATRPDWVWLPNELIDSANGEIAPVELVRQTSSAPTLRLLVDLYGAQNLAEDGGIHFRHVRQEYKRHKIGERGPYIVWGFVPGSYTRPNVPFVAPHLAQAVNDKDQLAAEEFWACWTQLCRLGLVETVAHLVYADTAEGEILHPMALEGTGLAIERAVYHAAKNASLTMITPGHVDWANNQGVVALAPVPLHIEKVEMIGIARLRYRPKTNRTLAFIGREAKWREVIARYEQIVDGHR